VCRASARPQRTPRVARRALWASPLRAAEARGTRRDQHPGRLPPSLGITLPLNARPATPSRLAVVQPFPRNRAARPKLSWLLCGLPLLLALVALALAAVPSAASSTRRAGSAPAIITTTYRLTPKVQQTVRFTGYATYRFKTPTKRRIVGATARIVGAQAHAVKISATSISHNHKRFTVKLVFPGEQGKPGKLVVRLDTVGA
jgi:hypothetical protein